MNDPGIGAVSAGCGVLRPIGGDGQPRDQAHVAQLVEHVLGKDEVTGSIPVMGSMNGVDKKTQPISDKEIKKIG
jgi:hypothetical protein